MQCLEENLTTERIFRMFKLQEAKMKCDLTEKCLFPLSGSQNPLKASDFVNHSAPLKHLMCLRFVRQDGNNTQCNIDCWSNKCHISKSYSSVFYSRVRSRFFTQLLHHQSHVLYDTGQLHHPITQHIMFNHYLINVRCLNTNTGF